MNLTDIFNRKSDPRRELPKAADMDELTRLRGVDLSRMPSLSHADLSGANLRNADLRPLDQRQEERTRAKRLWAIAMHKKPK